MAQQRPDYSFDPNELDQNALMQQLGVKLPEMERNTGGAPVSTTMPVDPRTPADLAAHRQEGEAGGNDMSWMDQPGATTVQTGGNFARPLPMPSPTPAATAAPPVTTTMGNSVTPRGNAPAGFDQKNWNDPGMQSVKYRAGRLLNGVTRPSEVASRVQSAEFQQAFPGATFDGKDRVNFQGAMSDGATGVPVYDIDVLQSADRNADTSNGLWWGHDVPGMATGPTGATGTPPPAPTAHRIDTVQPDRSVDDPMQKVLDEIEALQNGGASPMDQQALLQLLGI